MQLSIKKKLILSFGVMIFCMAALGAYSFHSLNAIDQASTIIAKGYLPSLNIINSIKANMDIVRRREYQHVVTGEPNSLREIEGDIAKAKAAIAQSVKEYEALSRATSATEADAREDIDKLLAIQDEWVIYETANAKTMALSRTGRKPEAIELENGEGKQAFDKASRAITQLINYNKEGAAAYSVENDKAFALTKQWLIIGFALIALISVFVVVLILRSLGKPIADLLQTSKQVAEGKLTVRAKVFTQDELGELADSYNQTIENLRILIQKIQDTARQVANSSRELTASAEQSAQVTQQIAGSVTEVSDLSRTQVEGVHDAADATAQISAGVGDSIGAVKQVSGQAKQAVESAQKGNATIVSAVEQMKSIETTVGDSAAMVTKLGERSKEIGQIVDTISGIAGQTNLLALNAAIEAARAGEMGKGFAVVAEEVRKLAEQSQAAAKQIESLIGSIQADTEHAVLAMHKGTREVKAGADVVDEAGKEFIDILEMVNQVDAQAANVARTMNELSEGTERISGAVKRIEDSSVNVAEEAHSVSAAAQEQSAAMEQIAASSRGLADLAQELRAASGRFSV